MQLSSHLLRVCILAGISLASASAATIFDNTSTDTLVTYLYDVNRPTAIGDSVGFGGTERLLTSAAVQFFNAGPERGTFSATLQLYQDTLPVVTAIGSAVQVNGIDIGSEQTLTVTFAFPNLLVPDFAIFTVSVTNVAQGLDLGLNVFTGPGDPAGPPAIGTSSLTSIILGDPLTTALTAAGEGNLYFLATAVAPSNDIPEPGSLLTLGTGLLALAASRLRRQ